MLRVIGILLVGPLLGYLIYNYYIDWSFYRRNGGDYSKHSGAADIYPGEVAGPPAKPYSNEQRVKFHSPLAIIVVSAIFIALCVAKDIN